MSDKGWWGDKLIFVITSGDERRHKNWCEHYDKEARVCTKTDCRCHGSAFCNEYVKRDGVGVVEPEKYSYIPKETPKTSYVTISEEIRKAPITKEIIGKQINPTIPRYISDIAPCHMLTYSNDQVGKVIIVNRGPDVVFGVMTRFDYDTFNIELDCGDIKKFDTKVAVRGKRIYVIDDISSAE